MDTSTQQREVNLEIKLPQHLPPQSKWLQLSVELEVPPTSRPYTFKYGDYVRKLNILSQVWMLIWSFLIVADPHDGGTLTINTVMEVYDEATHTYVMGVTGDPRFTHSRFTVKFLPGPTPDTSTLKWSCEYTPVDPAADSSGPTNIMDIVPKVFESFAPHAEEHIAKTQAA